jgi:hypothetical protein
LISLTSTWLDPARLCGDDHVIFFLSADNWLDERERNAHARQV